MEKYRLVRLQVGKLQNETFFQFMSENRRYYSRYSAEIPEIAEFMPEFNDSMTVLDAALEYIRKSPDTNRIALLDVEFDKTFSGMDAFAKSHLNHFDADVRAAAENLNVIFHHYGNIGRLPYREELAASHNLVEKLQSRRDYFRRLSREIAARHAVRTDSIWIP